MRPSTAQGLGKGARNFTNMDENVDVLMRGSRETRSRQLCPTASCQ